MKKTESTLVDAQGRPRGGRLHSTRTAVSARARGGPATHMRTCVCMCVSLASREEFGNRITSLPPPSHVSNAPADEWEEGEERAAHEDLDQPLVLVDERDEFGGLQNIVVRLLLDRLAGAR